MSDTRTIGEWTRDDVYNHTVDDIVAAHNAAIAAERNLRADWNYVIEELEKQLATEREKYERSQEKVKEYFDLLAAARKRALRWQK